MYTLLLSYCLAKAANLTYNAGGVRGTPPLLLGREQAARCWGATLHIRGDMILALAGSGRKHEHA